jgi:hypothetical protein
MRPTGTEKANGARGPAYFVARPERFERPTPKFVAWCSIQLSYGRTRARIIWKGFGAVKESGTRMHKAGSEEEKHFHGWRLIGVIMLVIGMLALISAVVDWAVLR